MNAQHTGRIQSAARIRKGNQNVMTLSEEDVIRFLDPQALLDGLEEGFRQLSRGHIQTPHRPELSLPGAGFILSMPAWRAGSPAMVKMVSVFEGNLQRELPNHLAIINLFDAATGMPICVMDATHITGIRTAASAVLSARALARLSARVATIIGAGVQAREHLALLPLVRDLEEIRITSLVHEDAEDLARSDPRAMAVRDVEAAVRDADIVCLCSHAHGPVISADWITPGTHVTSVGYSDGPGELPVVLACNGLLVVETPDAFQPQPVGCAELRDIDPSNGVQLGDILNGTAPGRSFPEQITVYKAMGIAMEDLVAAEITYRAALAAGHSDKMTL